eukprot:scaffold657_cov561-Prasinococcus_capsulatus_cf.AAC.2
MPGAWRIRPRPAPPILPGVGHVTPGGCSRREDGGRGAPREGGGTSSRLSAGLAARNIAAGPRRARAGTHARAHARTRTDEDDDDGVG